MFFSDEILEEVRNSNNIKDIISSYLKLTPKGGGYFGLCPFHNEKTPSFSVNESKQLYHCFGCGESGNVITFIMKIENYDFIDAVKHLANIARIDLEEIKNTNKDDYVKRHNEKKELLEIHKLSGRYYYDKLQSKEGVQCRDYIKKRSIVLSTQRKYGLGYSKVGKSNLHKYLLEKGYTNELLLKSGLIIKKDDKYYDRFFNRLMFPIFNVRGDIVGFGGRVIDNNMPKYLNSPETILFNKSKILYNLNFAIKKNTENFILVEGYLDVIAMEQSGITNSIATLGTAFNNEHMKILKRYAKKITILFDNDDAGIKATLKTIGLLVKSDIKVKVLLLNNAKDPDEYIKKFGAMKLKEELKNAKPYVLFKIETLKNKYDIKNLDEKIEFIKETVKILSSVESSAEREIYIKEVARITGIAGESLKEDIKEGKVVNNKVSKFVNIKKESENIKNNFQRKENVENILNMLICKPLLIHKVKDILKEEYIIDDDYRKALKIIFTNEENLTPSFVVSNFYEIEKQKKISKIFNTDIEFSNKEIEKALNDQLKTVLESYIKTKSNAIKKIEDLKEMNKLKQKIKNMYIKL